MTEGDDAFVPRPNFCGGKIYTPYGKVYCNRDALPGEPLCGSCKAAEIERKRRREEERQAAAAAEAAAPKKARKRA